MILRTITVLSALLSAALYALLDLSLWLVPVLFVGIGLGLMLAAFLFLWLVCALIDMDKPQEHDSKFHRVVTALYIEALKSLVGLKIETQGLEKTPKEGRILLVCNHQNESDPGILMHYFRDSQLAFISKKENQTMFIIGKLMHKLLCQLVNRENDREALKTILKCIQLIKDDEVSVAVFPEGGIKEKDKLNPFRHGVFKIAQKTGVPIVVCTLKGTSDLFDNMRKLKPTHVKLHLVDVIPAEDLKGRTSVDIGEQVYQMMLADLGDEYRLEEA